MPYRLVYDTVLGKYEAVPIWTAGASGQYLLKDELISVVGLPCAEAKKTIVKSVKWDARKTRIKRFEVEAKIRGLDPGATCKIEFNDKLVLSLSRLWWWEPADAEARVDMTASLRNGDNKFEATLHIDVAFLKVARVTVAYAVEYEGVGPEEKVKEPKPPLPDWVKWTIAGCAIVGTAVFISALMR